ncbi:MAG: hypothetical protein ACE5R7_08315 [Nitrosarchaeum sp.]
MKKGLIIGIVIGIIILGLLVVSLSTFEDYAKESSSEEQTSEKSPIEGKNYVLKLDDTVSAASQP